MGSDLRAASAVVDGSRRMSQSRTTATNYSHAIKQQLDTQIALAEAKARKAHLRKQALLTRKRHLEEAERNARWLQWGQRLEELGVLALQDVEIEKVLQLALQLGQEEHRLSPAKGQTNGSECREG